MLEHDRIDMSKGMDPKKTKESHKYITQNDYFLKVNFRFLIFQKYQIFNIPDGCHNFMQKAVSFNNVTIVFGKGNYYRIHFW